MKLVGGLARIIGCTGSRRSGTDMVFYDDDRTEICIPISVIARLHEIAKFEVESIGTDWDAFVAQLVDADINHSKGKFE